MNCLLTEVLMKVSDFKSHEITDAEPEGQQHELWQPKFEVELFSLSSTSFEVSDFESQSRVDPSRALR